MLYDKIHNLYRQNVNRNEQSIDLLEKMLFITQTIFLLMHFEIPKI